MVRPHFSCTELNNDPLPSLALPCEISIGIDRTRSRTSREAALPREPEVGSHTLTDEARRHSVNEHEI